MAYTFSLGYLLRIKASGPRALPSTSLYTPQVPVYVPSPPSVRELLLLSTSLLVLGGVTHSCQLSGVGCFLLWFYLAFPSLLMKLSTSLFLGHLEFLL